MAKPASHCLLDTKKMYLGDIGNGSERRVRKWTDQIGAPVSPNSHCVGSGAWCPRWRPHTGCVDHPGTATPGPPRYTWWTTQMSPFHCSAESTRLFISRLQLTTSSTERDHQVIHHLFTPDDRQRWERSPHYSSLVYTWWQGDHCFIAADSDHWVSHQSPASVLPPFCTGGGDVLKQLQHIIQDQEVNPLNANWPTNQSVTTDVCASSFCVDYTTWKIAEQSV